MCECKGVCKCVCVLFYFSLIVEFMLTSLFLSCIHVHTYSKLDFIYEGRLASTDR